MNRQEIRSRQTAADGKIYRLPSLHEALIANADALDRLRQGPPAPVQKNRFETMGDFYAWARLCAIRNDKLAQRHGDVSRAVKLVMRHLAVKPGHKIFEADRLKRKVDRDLSKAAARAAYEIVLGRGLNAIPLAPEAIARPPQHPAPSYEMMAAK